MTVLIHILNESFLLLAAMGPYFLLGILIAGLLHVVLKVETVAQHLGHNNFTAVLKAAIVGIPLPICSCGVVPLAASLKKSGAGNGATVSFLTTTPTTGVDSILATYSLLGAPLAALRVAYAFIIGIVAGLVSNKQDTIKPSATPVQPATHKKNPVKAAVIYALDELMAGIAKPLIIGILLGGAITYFIPDDFLASYATTGILAYLAMVIIGTPLYICATGSIPLAAALMMKGISPGAAVVFLIAGPATNMATIAVISDIIGKKHTAIYLIVLILGAIGTGFATDALFAATGWTVQMPGHGAHTQHSISVLEYISGVAVGLIALYHIGRPYVKKIVQPRKDPGGMEYIVKDMTCKHCATTITNAVTGIDGVKSVNADPDSKRVRIDIEDGTDATQIKLAIQNAGYNPEDA